MGLADLFRKQEPAADTLPDFIRIAQDIRGVRVLRLQGRVGKDIGAEVQAHNERFDEDVFAQPLLLDFADTSGWDFATIAYLVEALRLRMAKTAPVGLVHAPRELIDELDIARLEGLFQIFDSEEDALHQLAAAR